MGKALGIPYDTRSVIRNDDEGKVIRMTGDSRCTTSMTYKGDILSNYFHAVPKSHFIETADGTECEVKGYGQICGEAEKMKGKLRDVCIKQVYHVKELRETTLSLTTATKKNGCTFVQAPKVSTKERAPYLTQVLHLLYAQIGKSS